LPSKVSRSENPCLSAAATANGLKVDPTALPVTAQLIWESM